MKTSAQLLGLTALLLLAPACAPATTEETAPGAETEAHAGDPLEYPQWETVEPGEYHAYNQRTSLVQRGRIVYREHCMGCHGEYGDGNGPAAARLITKPRDFTSGIYKFRSTDSSSLPLESDLHRTITQGLARVSMPAFPLMSERDKVAVIEYVKGFYPDWENDKKWRVKVPVPLAPDDLADEERILRGRVVYLEMGCAQCHGIDGRGTGATQTEYTDAWGNPQKAFDFTRGRLKSGERPEDVYRTFQAGLVSIMPSFGEGTLAGVTREAFDAAAEGIDAAEIERLRAMLDDFPESSSAVFGELSEGERNELAVRNSWDLVAYVLSLRTRTSTAPAVLGTTP